MMQGRFYGNVSRVRCGQAQVVGPGTMHQEGGLPQPAKRLIAGTVSKH